MSDKKSSLHSTPDCFRCKNSDSLGFVCLLGFRAEEKLRTCADRNRNKDCGDYEFDERNLLVEKPSSFLKNFRKIFAKIFLRFPGSW